MSQQAMRSYDHPKILGNGSRGSPETSHRIHFGFHHDSEGSQYVNIPSRPIALTAYRGRSRNPTRGCARPSAVPSIRLLPFQASLASTQMVRIEELTPWLPQGAVRYSELPCPPPQLDPLAEAHRGLQRRMRRCDLFLREIFLPRLLC